MASPVARGVATPSSAVGYVNVCVQCPFCAKKHKHSLAASDKWLLIDHRISHCRKSPRQYRIEVLNPQGSG